MACNCGFRSLGVVSSLQDLNRYVSAADGDKEVHSDTNSLRAGSRRHSFTYRGILSRYQRLRRFPRSAYTEVTTKGLSATAVRNHHYRSGDVRRLQPLGKATESAPRPSRQGAYNHRIAIHPLYPYREEVYSSTTTECGFSRQQHS